MQVNNAEGKGFENSFRHLFVQEEMGSWTYLRHYTKTRFIPQLIWVTFLHVP
jgi:hypothetical protein